jgi:acylpyruvate hydrolase
MRLATIRQDGSTRAARVDGDTVVPLDAPDAVTALTGASTHPANGRQPVPLADVDLAPVVPRPRKIICLGLNYESHILEMGHDLPEHPTCFAKFAIALIGARDDIVLPKVSSMVDWEAELAVVIGRSARHVTEAEALDHVAGYTICNDVSARDYQRRTSQWLQGKTFERSTPLGPVLVTGDEIDHASDLALGCDVDGDVRQQARTSELVFTPAKAIAYLSEIMTLEPGDVISTGTTGGVGAGRDPQVFLEPGQVVRTHIEGIGELVNTCVAE